jgi:mono/diheme cytochrome c family protein
MTGRLAVAALLLLAGCSRDEAPAPTASSAPSDISRPAPSTAAVDGDPEKGRQVYLGQCTACHNTDPSRDGALGPAIKGAARELVEARVVHGTYPPGYTPKRPSKVMPARPDLAPSVGDLAAYLAKK